MLRRAGHWGKVFAAAFRAAGWAAGIATVVLGGSVLTAAGFLVRSHQRTLAVAVFAAGLAVFILEGSYRVWNASDEELQQTKGRLRELDTVGAKRAYLDEQIEEAHALIRECESVTQPWRGELPRLVGDIDHWDDEVRATLRRNWGREYALKFDRHTEQDESDHYASSEGPDNLREYLERRITRLVELRDETR